MGICVSCRRRERKAPEKRSVPGAGGLGKGAAAAELLPRRLDRLPMMANSMSNIKMTNPIKGIVSKRRRRYMKDGFNLDLAYITDRLIAMGFPAEKLEGVYRNHIDEVYRFLEKMHKDHYKIYNLCSERSYDSSKFHERVVRYAFEDHTPPKIEMIQPFCEDVHSWLSADSKNVAAVHCKAGKGRTGTMVCCYLLYSRQKMTADEALKFYGTKRTHDEKGVTIPSQRRYVEYYASLLHAGLQYAPTKIHVRELVLSPPPFLLASHAAPELLITQAKPFFKTPMGCHEVVRTDNAVHVHLTHCTPLCGDVRVDVYSKPKMKMRKEKLFHFWFNTFFIAHPRTTTKHPPLADSPNLEAYKLTLNKWQLDDAHKDKQHKHYSQDFKVELIVQKMPESSTFIAHPAAADVSPRAPSPPSSTASSCSDGDGDDAHWDSGERIPYSRLTPDHSEICDDTTDTGDVTHPTDTGQHNGPPLMNNQLAPNNSLVTPKHICVDTCDVTNPTDTGQHNGPPPMNNQLSPNNSLVTPKHLSTLINSSIPSKDGLRDSPITLNPDPMVTDDSPLLDAPIAIGFIALSDPLVAKDVGMIRDSAVVLKNPPAVLKDPMMRSPVKAQLQSPVKLKSPKKLQSHNSVFENAVAAEPMDYFPSNNDVFSSQPSSARESPVEECKSKRADDKSKPRLSLGDMRASWREFSGKFASDIRRRKEDT